MGIGCEGWVACGWSMVHWMARQRLDIGAWGVMKWGSTQGDDSAVMASVEWWYLSQIDLFGSVLSTELPADHRCTAEEFN
jgi:hypothetical protein